MNGNWWRRGDGGPKRDFSLPQSRARLDQELLEEFRATETGEECPQSTGFFAKLKGMWE